MWHALPQVALGFHYRELQAAQGIPDCVSHGESNMEWAKMLIKYVRAKRKELKVGGKRWAVLLLDLYAANRDANVSL